MENKINKKVELYIEQFRENIRSKILDLDIDNEMQNKLLETIYSFNTLHLDKEDFMKRKRIVSSVPLSDRCSAKKANGDQCTRKRKNDCAFCGTHDKFQPHGIVETTGNQKKLKRCSITIIDINGINYYIDENNNVYSTADILCNSQNPNIVGKVSNIGGKLEFIKV